MKALVLACGLGAVCAACSHGQSGAVGPTEPFRVRGTQTQFFRGPLPGTPALDGGSLPGADAGGPAQVKSIELVNRVFTQGEAGASVSGHLTTNAVAVALALDGVGDGYWLFPAGFPDQSVGDLTYSATCDIDVSAPTGLHALTAVAIDADNVAGPQTSVDICVASVVPDNLHSCAPSQVPPAAAISLDWDANVDLDLQVVAPDGSIVDSKHPILTEGDAGMAVAQIDRDSNGNCVIDGIRRETLVWQKEVPHGTYHLYANLFDTCKQPSVRFVMSVYTAEPDGDGGQELKLWFQKGGEILASQVSPDATLGLFVSDFEFQ